MQKYAKRLEGEETGLQQMYSQKLGMFGKDGNLVVEVRDPELQKFQAQSCEDRYLL